MIENRNKQKEISNKFSAAGFSDVYPLHYVIFFQGIYYFRRLKNFILLINKTMIAVINLSGQLTMW